MISTPGTSLGLKVTHVVLAGLKTREPLRYSSHPIPVGNSLLKKCKSDQCYMSMNRSRSGSRSSTRHFVRFLSLLVRRYLFTHQDRRHLVSFPSNHSPIDLNGTGIFGKRNYECCYQESTLRPSEF